MKTHLKKNYFAIKSYSELLLLVALLLMIIVSVSSCKKEAKVEPTPEVVKNTVTGTIDGKTISITESGIASTVYSSSGDAVKSLETGATLNPARDKLNFFINDLKNGAIALEKKTGTSFNPGSRTIQINDNGTGTVGVQTYVSYLSGGNTYYAYSGQITITVDATTITIKWTISFKDATGRIFTSDGTYTINYASVVTKPKSDVKDPTPVASKPTIENIAPTSGKVGDSVSITGVNYSTVLADNVVKFNSVAATVLSATATKLVVKAPTSTTGAISVQVKNSEVTSGPTFTYVQPATFTSFAPTTAKVGDTLTVTGTNFSTTAADNVFKFTAATGTINGTVAAATATQLKVVVPQSAITGAVSLSVKGGTTLTNSTIFTLTTPTSNLNGWTAVDFSGTLLDAMLSASSGNKMMFTPGIRSLYYTTDGTNFTNVFPNLPFAKDTLKINNLVADGLVFYAVTNLGLAKTTDGSTWTKLTPSANIPDAGFNGLAASNNVLRTIRGSVLYTSSNAGDTWTNATMTTAGAKSLDYITSDFNGKYFYAVDAGNNGAGGTKIVYRSTNQGTTWTATTGNTGIYPIAEGYKNFITAPSSTFLIYRPVTSTSITDQRLYKTTSQGDAWTKVSDEQVNVVKAFGDYQAFGGTSFNLSSNGTTFNRFDIPQGYAIGGIEKMGSTFYIFCTLTSNGTHKLFKRGF